MRINLPLQGPSRHPSTLGNLNRRVTVIQTAQSSERLSRRIQHVREVQVPLSQGRTNTLLEGMLKIPPLAPAPKHRKERHDSDSSRPPTTPITHPFPSPIPISQALSLPFHASLDPSILQLVKPTVHPMIPQATTPAISHIPIPSSPISRPTVTTPLSQATPRSPSAHQVRGRGRGLGNGQLRSNPTPLPFIPTLTTSSGRRSLAAATVSQDSTTPGSATARAICDLIHASPFDSFD
jgi:hypothetical protein